MKIKKYQLLILLKLAIAILLIAVILSKVNLNEVWLALLNADRWLIAAAFFLYFIGLLVIAARWKLLLTVQGVSANFPTLVQSMIIAVFFNNLLPSTIGGDAMRAYDSWRMGSGKTQALSIVFIDRLFGVFTLFVFALLALLSTPVDITFIPAMKHWVLLALVIGFLIIYILFFQAYAISRYLHSKRHPGTGLMTRLLHKTIDVFAAYNGRPEVLLAALLLSILLQLNVVFHYYLLALALGITVPVESMFIIIPVAIVVMMIPISINAIGIREVIFVAMFGAFGVNSADALAFAWMSFVLLTILGVIGGVVFVLRKNISRKS